MYRGKCRHCTTADIAYLLGPAVRDAPLSGDRSVAAAGNDDDVAFVGDGRQGGNVVEPKEAHAHSVKIATCNGIKQVGLII